MTCESRSMADTATTMTMTMALVWSKAKLLMESNRGLADAAGADQAEHGRRTGVGFEAVECIAGPQRRHLRQNPPDDLVQRAGAGGPDALDRGAVDRLHRLGEQLAEHAAGVDRQGHDPRERSKPHRGDEDGPDHQVRHRTQDVEKSPHGLLHPGRRDIARPGQAERYGDDDGQGGAPQRHLHRQPHVDDIDPVLREVRSEELHAQAAHIVVAGEHLTDLGDFRAAKAGDEQQRQAPPDRHVEQALADRPLRRRRDG